MYNDNQSSPADGAEPTPKTLCISSIAQTEDNA
jgi:hypothetical protein